MLLFNTTSKLIYFLTKIIFKLLFFVSDENVFLYDKTPNATFAYTIANGSVYDIPNNSKEQFFFSCH